jgi:hypothetical protein
MSIITVHNNHFTDNEEEDYDYSTPNSSAFESCSSDLTDDSSCSSVIIQKEEDYLLYPPLSISFHESLSYNILKLYQVKTFFFNCI